MERDLNNDEGLKAVASEVVNRLLEKEAIVASEASSILAYLKFLRDINSESQDDDFNDTFEIQL